MHAVAVAPRDWIVRALWTAFGRFPHATKRAAQAAHANPRTAEKWLAGQSLPASDSLVQMMVECDALHDEINRYIVEAREALRG